jgi:arsenate reductase
MIKIYHNPRCKKSREGLEILKESRQKFKIVEYLKTTLSFNELKSIIDLLDITPIELIRKNEAIWKDHYKGKILGDDEIIYLMIEHPKLIERPIVINKQKAIIGRPPENIKQVL